MPPEAEALPESALPESAMPPEAEALPESAPPSEEASPAWLSTYLRVRAREGRLYPDAVVRELPDAFGVVEPLREEWRQRAQSSGMLIAYLAGLARPLSIVDIGCGNGWLARRMAELPGSRVVGFDANAVELAQAQRVFAEVPNLRFVLGDAREVAPLADEPDIIVLAAMLQYVPDAPALLRRLGEWLRPGGEIHVIDSPIYGDRAVDAARERTRRHYAALGVPEMAAFYGHPRWSDIDVFRPDVLYRPPSRLVRWAPPMLRRSGPAFPWLRIRFTERGRAG